MTKKVNTHLLKKWIADESISNPDARLDLCKKALISSSTLDKALCGTAPGRQSCFLIALATGIPEKKLFPEEKTPKE